MIKALISLDQGSGQVPNDQPILCHNQQLPLSYYVNLIDNIFSYICEQRPDTKTWISTPWPAQADPTDKSG